MNKICSDCNSDKEVSEFGKDSKQSDGYKSYCRFCGRQRVYKKYKASEKYKYVASVYRLKEYGLTEETYQHLIKIQNNCCAICYKTFETNKIYIDHCHQTGIVRGLLCLQCNTSLGNFNDDINILLNAIRYLTKKEDK